MKTSPFSLVVCLAPLHAIAVASSFKPSVREFDSLAFPPARRLYPAVNPTALIQRNSELRLLKRETSFDYVEDSGPLATRSDSTVFTTTLNVKGKRPILSLEDLESDIRQIRCFPSKIELEFLSAGRLDEVSKELSAAGIFIVVTSHSECNNEDERAPHMVTEVGIERQEKRITLWKTNTDWKEVFTSTEVQFARQPSNQVSRRWHQNLKRQDEPSRTHTMSFPSAPTSSDLPPNTSDELDMRLNDQVILPPETPVTGLFVPEGVTLKCKRCTLQGNAELSQGSFRLEEIDGPEDVIPAAVNFFREGSIELDVNGLSSHIELAVVLENEEPIEFSIPLPTIPLSPFAIPGLVTFGVFVRPQITASLQFDKDIEFSYGFNASVPDDSKFTLDIGNLGNSTVTGFPNTTFQALPFQSEEDIDSISFSLAFNPEILLGVHSLVGSTTGGIGMFFNLPEIAVNASKMNNVDRNCNPKRETNEEDEVFGNFTNIIPSVELSFGPIAELEVNLGSFDPAYETQVAIASASFPLPTTCLAYDQETKSYGDPVKVARDRNSQGAENAAGRLNTSTLSTSVILPAMLASVVFVFGVLL
ncbi:hypothetical protein CISG_01066 [Coccidioides immitis RMSCC 3703]|uniref:GPI anchored protein n=2 Tax=Coccidioides immitis TaxID=5501 RepID=A0A0J8TRH3_COCIT|nr:hypothetical protein CIRG_01828 [Coccidioides immitis RMSCC 2394]KMU76332.1 hypothetical protein CISG_01066 [Coccidioides immitis RMSCC 3703]